MIIRDDMGQFVAARTQKIAGPVEPYVGELVAAKHGLLFALELGKDRAELEVDVRNVCKSIAESDQNRSYGSNILRDFFFFFLGIAPVIVNLDVTLDLDNITGWRML